MSYTGSGIEENVLSGSILSLRQHSLQRGANHDRNDIMALTRLLVGLWASAQAFLGPVPAPRRAVPLNVIEAESGTDEKEIFSETTSISGALAELWQVLANPPPPGDFRAMYFPACEGLKRPQTFQALFEHLEVCKDSSQNFGAHIHAMYNSAWKLTFNVTRSPSTRPHDSHTGQALLTL